MASAIRAAVACVVAIALAGGWLTLPLLIAAAVVLGAGPALGGAVNILLLRSIVPGEQLTLALTQDEVRINGASLAGPALAGALYGLHHVAPFTFTAAAFFLALTATALLPAGRAHPTPSQEPAEGGMLAGIRELWGQPVLRAAVMLIMGVNTVGAGPRARGHRDPAAPGRPALRHRAGARRRCRWRPRRRAAGQAPAPPPAGCPPAGEHIGGSASVSVICVGVQSARACRARASTTTSAPTRTSTATEFWSP